MDESSFKLLTEGQTGDGLPIYHSPELNPDEYLNCDLKALVHGGKPAKNRDELESRVQGAMLKQQNRLERVQTYFKHPKIQYAA